MDAAVHVGHNVIDMMGGVDSARPATSLTDLRRGLNRHQHVPAVRNFVEYTS